MLENKCEMCQMGMPVLDQAAIAQALESLQGWTYCDKKNALMRSFEFKGFYNKFKVLSYLLYQCILMNYFK